MCVCVVKPTKSVTVTKCAKLKSCIYCRNLSCSLIVYFPCICWSHDIKILKNVIRCQKTQYICCHTKKVSNFGVY